MSKISKKDQLKDKVIALVKEFVQTEGGLTLKDLRSLFGCGEVKNCLDDLKVST